MQTRLCALLVALLLLLLVWWCGNILMRPVNGISSCRLGRPDVYARVTPDQRDIIKGAQRENESEIKYICTRGLFFLLFVVLRTFYGSV